MRRRKDASALKVISRKSAKRAGAAPRRAAHARVLRIIGGTWRGRKLRFPAAAAIRPTPDRVRETLFNWLGAATAGARCLDAFAGSGALGLEALSRGAAHVTFIEQEAAAVAALRERLAEWGAGNALVVRADALRHLAAPPAHPYDIVFLDPPFAAGLLARAAALLEHGWLREGALVYVECAAREPLPSLPASWQPLKAKQAGEVGYHLFAHAARGVTRAV
ncbi:MAG TPA: 16S rRNA (guanine(966)-N(2))-methyltransferase RsmD [Steroidobacteraceae bacterium]|nr:16S rRNA (guanine(966)-N(2))-methyltransferase RsmD [Steroidobacteraceae bacterium]